MTQKFNVKITKQRVVAAKFVGASSQTTTLSNNVDQKHDVVVAAQLDVEIRQNDVIARQTDVTNKQSDITTKQTDVTTKRDEAVAAQTASELARDQSVTAQGASETARDQSVIAQGLSETARDASIAAQGASETARDASIAAQTAAETARDEAQAFAPGKATQGQAEAGTDDATYMTPLKTSQAIAALAGVDTAEDFTWTGNHRFTKTIELDPSVSGMRALINNNSDILNIGFDDDEDGNLDNPIALRLIAAGGLNYGQMFGNTIWDEGTLPKASQAEAEAGTASDRLMTPERTKQAISALGGVPSTPWILTSSLLSTDEVSAFNTLPEGCILSGDGTSIGILRRNGSVIRFYRNQLNVPWVLSSLNTNGGVSFDFSAQTNSGTGIAMSDDGRYVYILDPTGVIYQYTFTTPFDATTGSFTASVSIAANTTTPLDIHIDSTGQHIVVVDNVQNLVHFEMSTPHTITSASFTSSTSLTTLVVNSTAHDYQGVAVSNDGSRVVIINRLGGTTHAIEILPVSTPWDFTTLATAIQNVISTTWNGECKGLFIDGEGFVGYSCDTADDTVKKFFMNVTELADPTNGGPIPRHPS